MTNLTPNEAEFLNAHLAAFRQVASPVIERLAERAAWASPEEHAQLLRLIRNLRALSMPVHVELEEQMSRRQA